jgi:hypothetical protein
VPVRVTAYTVLRLVFRGIVTENVLLVPTWVKAVIVCVGCDWLKFPGFTKSRTFIALVVGTLPLIVMVEALAVPGTVRTGLGAAIPP